ncbi:MAG: D-2-hydroxyacid dehydrogenase [Flavobacteriales bacterium AspAUS03]
MKILANDGLSTSGITALKDAGFEFIEQKVAQDQLARFINEYQVEILLVRSTTKVPQILIDICTGLKLIGRGGVGLDNIDVAYARKKGVEVINTPEASSHSVAELVFSHLFGMARFLHETNREMPLQGDQNFKTLKKNYSKGIELKGKTLGVIGAGRIGKAVMKIALGTGMDLKVFDQTPDDHTVTLNFFDGQEVSFKIPIVSKEEVLKKSDFITLHVPKQDHPILSEREFAVMKRGVGIINTSRGGLVNESNLLKALNTGQVAYAGLDVFENEPTPSMKVLMHPQLSLSPHIGGSTQEAQDQIGIELAQQIIRRFPHPTR